MDNTKQIQIKTVKLTEPLYRIVDQHNHSITVWRFAGKVLSDLGLEQNGDLQYALMGWLKKYGSQTNPITGIFFSTHGVPYAIDFFNSKNNLYIPREDFEKLYKNATGNEWKANKDAAYVSDIINLVKAKIISDDVTITLCGCLNGAGEFLISEKMESVTKQWQLENGKLKEPKNIAYYFSKLLPKATVIANTTNVDSGVGLDIPVIYRNGVYTKL